MKPMFLFAFVGVTIASISEINFRNLCDHDIEVVRADEFSEPELEVRLKPKDIRLVAYPGGNMTFRSGFHGKTASVFWLHQNGHDFYGLNVTDGFDMDMSIEPYNGRNISCISESCKDAIHSPNDMHHKLYPRRRQLQCTYITSVEKTSRLGTYFIMERKNSRSIGHGHHKITTLRNQKSFQTAIGGTKIVITLNKDGFDYHCLSAGFFFKEVTVESDKREILKCRTNNCPSFQEVKLSQVTGGVIHIYWCPEQKLDDNLW